MNNEAEDESTPTIREGIDWPWVSQGFVNGVGLYSATPVLLSLIRRKRVDPSVWRTAVAAGTFLGGYRLACQLLDHYQSRRSKAGPSTRLPKVIESTEQLIFEYRNFIAGGAATFLGLAVDDMWLSPTLVAWWAARALRCIVPDVPHGSTIAMCVAASILNPAAFLFQNEHERSYQKFMERMALIKRHTLLRPDEPLPGPGIHGWDRLTICDELIGEFPSSSLGSHHSCTWAVLTTIAPRLFLVSLKLYAPLYLAWNVFKLRWPDSRLLESILTSSLFLTVYSGLQYLVVLLWTSTVSPTITRNQHASLAWVSGLATLIERKERRVELATYCAAHAVNALSSRFARTKYFRRSVTRVFAWLLLVVSSGILTHFHQTHAPFVRSLFGFDRK